MKQAAGDEVSVAALIGASNLRKKTFIKWSGSALILWAVHLLVRDFIFAFTHGTTEAAMGLRFLGLNSSHPGRAFEWKYASRSNTQMALSLLATALWRPLGAIRLVLAVAGLSPSRRHPRNI
ncbi:MAG: hypothetical protein AABM32_01800 [Chloroflexota bacterium]